MGYSCISSSLDVICVELEALRFGLFLAQEWGFRELYCELDCLEALSLMNA